jgi:CRISPR system Cascade subunit CasB
MKGFIKWLEDLNERDTKVRAVLRRSLAFDPGRYSPAFPYVEPFLKNEENFWRRDMFYLVAGLWASHWRNGRSGAPLTFGKACASYQVASGSTNTERRFITLLDADADQLPHRLRQMVALLKDQSIDFGDLLNGLSYWNDDRKRTQNIWAKDFYRNLNQETQTIPSIDKEISE